MLAQHFLRAAGSSAKLTSSAIEALRGHDWPGNVRELEHQMQRLASLSVDEMGRETLPREIRSASRRIGRGPTRIEPITSVEKSNELCPRAEATSATPPNVSASRDMV